MQFVTMKHRGQHFLSLHVPGLAERRPSLVVGDHIFAKLATAYASEIITPYQVCSHFGNDREETRKVVILIQ